MKLVFRAQHGVQGRGDMRRPFLGRSTKAVKQAQAGSLASVSQGGSASGVWDRESRQQDGVTSLGAQRRSWPSPDPALPFMEILGHVGAWSGGRQASRGAGLQGCGEACLAREPRDLLGAEKLRALSLCPDPEHPLKPGSGAALGGTAHPCLPLRLVLWPSQCIGGWVPRTTPSPRVQATLTPRCWW